jgi:type IV pilus assembly protein PilX
MNGNRRFSGIRQQRGAALVVGMVLLLVLTLLAMSGMNTASTELVMAGNTQFEENAFQASETGIEIAMTNGPFNPSTASVPVAPTLVPGTTNDRYSTNITPVPGLNMPMQALWGNRWDSFSTFHFQVTSTGTSSRNASTTHTQGMFVVAPFDTGTPPPLAGVPTALN